MDFIDEIKTLAAKIPKVTKNINTEEATKNALVLPMINILGYNIFDPKEVTPEFTTDHGTKKGEKVDFAIFKDGSICDNIKGYAEFQTANVECIAHACGIIDCAANDDIDLRVRHDDGGNVDITCVNLNLNVVQVGGT